MLRANDAGRRQQSRLPKAPFKVPTKPTCPLTPSLTGGQGWASGTEEVGAHCTRASKLLPGGLEMVSLPREGPWSQSSACRSPA